MKLKTGIRHIMAKTRTTPPALLVPDHWTADEALTVVAFLERLITAAWATHGEAMADSLFRSQMLAEDLASESSESDFEDDSFPF